ncbi:hypothetical protein [Hydrogenophaga borbori]|uniref:hypothetical protein n=1 Tax=Hydrogenophaga borbori TaxID=2294117 RepID=UPI0011C1CF19|nr:hypothetical protein [Hydrogenophaga borbori]
MSPHHGYVLADGLDDLSFGRGQFRHVKPCLLCDQGATKLGALHLDRLSDLVVESAALTSVGFELLKVVPVGNAVDDAADFLVHLYVVLICGGRMPNAAVVVLSPLDG